MGVPELLFLLSRATVVTVVGVAATAALVVDLVRRELGGPQASSQRSRHVGAALTLVFAALVVARFVLHGR